MQDESHETATISELLSRRGRRRIGVTGVTSISQAQSFNFMRVRPGVLRDKLIINPFQDLKLISHPPSHSSLLAPRSTTTTHSQEIMPAVFSRPERVQI